MRIKLRQIAQTSASTIFEDAVIILGFSQNPQKPILLCFENTSEAQQKEWQTYGPDSEVEVVSVQFSQPNETKLVNIVGKNLKVKLLNVGQETFNYPKTGPEEIYFYEFSILDADRFQSSAKYL